MALDDVVTGRAANTKANSASCSGKQKPKRSARNSPGASGFDGLSPKTFGFLNSLTKHNDKAWFEAHRTEYEELYLEPALRLIGALGPRLQKIRPVEFEPRVNGSLFRIHRDIRFSKDKRPYKDHIDLWFWEGEKRRGDSPGFFLRITGKAILFGAGVHQFSKEELARYREAVVEETSGKKLRTLLRSLEKAGYDRSGATRKRVPKGFDSGHSRADLLLFDGLSVFIEVKLPLEVRDATFLNWVDKHARKLARVSEWVNEHIAE